MVAVNVELGAPGAAVDEHGQGAAMAGAVGGIVTIDDQHAAVEWGGAEDEVARYLRREAEQ